MECKCLLGEALRHHVALSGLHRKVEDVLLLDLRVPSPSHPYPHRIVEDRCSLVLLVGLQPAAEEATRSVAVFLSLVGVVVYPSHDEVAVCPIQVDDQLVGPLLEVEAVLASRQQGTGSDAHTHSVSEAGHDGHGGIRPLLGEHDVDGRFAWFQPHTLRLDPFQQYHQQAPAEDWLSVPGTSYDPIHGTLGTVVCLVALTVAAPSGSTDASKRPWR